MERDAFKLLDAMERSWWYRGRIAVVRAGLRRVRVGRTGDALDFGAGFGGMRAMLADFGEHIDAFEPDLEAKAAASKRGYRTVFSSDTEAFSHSYGLIGLFDVVEHVEDDATLLKSAYGALATGGIVSITVPAFPFLWSAHDVTHHHYRRYTKASMRAALEQAGFAVEYASYWNMTLFVPAAALRLMGRSGENGLSLPKYLDALFLGIIRIESFLMRFMPLPFGTGLVMIARRR